MEESKSKSILPAVSDAFHWTSESWGHALRCRPLEAIAPHLFTTRQLQLTTTADEERLAAAIRATELRMVKQVHGNHVVRATEAAGRLTAAPPYPEGDALVSDIPGVAIAVRAADCVPLLMADRRSGVVAAVHAGWRGTVARVTIAALDAMREQFGTSAADLIVAIGPAIGSCCYEVGTELVDAFAAAGHERYLIDRWFIAPPPPRGSQARSKLKLDVPGANRDQLMLAGVPEEQIHIAGLCTAMHLDVLTSYRAEKDKAGRIAGVIARQV